MHEHTLLGDSPAWFFPGNRHTLPLEVEGGQYPGEVTEYDMKRGKGHGTKYIFTSNLASVHYTHVDVSVSLLMFCINFVHVEVCACVCVCVCM